VSSRGQIALPTLNDQVGAIASGAFPTGALVILPGGAWEQVGSDCSGCGHRLSGEGGPMSTSRRRPLSDAPREMPWNLIHLRNLIRPG